MRTGDRDLILLGLLLVWSEARRAREHSRLADEILNADPLTLDSLKRRMIDQGLNKVIDLFMGGGKL